MTMNDEELERWFQKLAELEQEKAAIEEQLDQVKNKLLLTFSKLGIDKAVDERYGTLWLQMGEIRVLDRDKLVQLLLECGMDPGVLRTMLEAATEVKPRKTTIIFRPKKEQK